MFRFYKKETENFLNNKVEMIIEYKAKNSYLIPKDSDPSLDINKIIEKELKEILFKILAKEFLNDENKIKEMLNSLRYNLSICERNEIIDKLEKELFPNISDKIEKIPVIKVTDNNQRQNF